MADKPILDLDDIADRALVKFEGQHYELRNAAELSIIELRRIEIDAKSIQRAYSVEESLTDAELQALAGTLKRLCVMLLDAPADVHERLSDAARMRIVMGFINILRGQVPSAQEGADAASPSSGESKSLDSSASTAEAPTTGSAESPVA